MIDMDSAEEREQIMAAAKAADVARELRQMAAAQGPFSRFRDVPAATRHIWIEAAESIMRRITTVH